VIQYFIFLLNNAFFKQKKAKFAKKMVVTNVFCTMNTYSNRRVANHLHGLIFELKERMNSRQDRPVMQKLKIKKKKKYNIYFFFSFYFIKYLLWLIHSATSLFFFLLCFNAKIKNSK
jgi:hypothetical protein